MNEWRIKCWYELPSPETLKQVLKQLCYHNIENVNIYNAEYKNQNIK